MRKESKEYNRVQKYLFLNNGFDVIRSFKSYINYYLGKDFPYYFTVSRFDKTKKQNYTQLEESKIISNRVDEFIKSKGVMCKSNEVDVLIGIYKEIIDERKGIMANE